MLNVALANYVRHLPRHSKRGVLRGFIGERISVLSTMAHHNIEGLVVSRFQYSLSVLLYERCAGRSRGKWSLKQIWVLVFLAPCDWLSGVICC